MPGRIRGGHVVTHREGCDPGFHALWHQVSSSQVQIESVQLMLLLEGIDFSRVKSPKRWQPPSISRPIDKAASV